nr:MetaGeneMark_Unknown Function [uncultured bacterium]
MAIIASVGYGCYQFIPIAFQSYKITDLMQHYVDTAVTMGYPASWVKGQLVNNGPEYGIPRDAVITPAQEDNRIIVRVQFSQPIQLPFYTYDYVFDRTVKSATFLSVK